MVEGLCLVFLQCCAVNGKSVYLWPHHLFSFCTKVCFFANKLIRAYKLQSFLKTYIFIGVTNRTGRRERNPAGRVFGKRVKVTSDKGKSQECNPILSMTTSPVLFCLGGTHTENFISVSLQISLHVFWSLVSHRDGDFGQQLSEKQSEENNVEHVIVATGLELWEYKRNMLDRPSGKVSCSRRRVRFFTLWMQEEAGHWSVCLF